MCLINLVIILIENQQIYKFTLHSDYEIKMSIYNQILTDLTISNKRHKYLRQKYINLKNQQKSGVSGQTFTELQSLVNQEQQQHNLIIGKGCSCKVCLKNSQAIHINQDNYLTTSPDSDLNLFALLQHLTMIQTQQVCKLLGKFPIPIFFFKRQINNPKQENKNKRKGVSIQQPSFVVFKNDLNTGFLQHPFVIKSFYKLARLIQFTQQANRKLKNKQKQYQKHLVNIHQGSQILELSDSSNFVHTKHFHESIPSYAFPSEKIKSMQSVHQYIIHQEDGYIKQDVEDHKLKKSEPFCIFRYKTVQKQEKISKYQIFTLQTLAIYDRKRQVGYNSIKVEQKTLNLIYVQSYTKIKAQQLKSKSTIKKTKLKTQGGKAVINKSIQTIYLSYYSQDQFNKDQLKNCPIFKLVELEIKLRLQQVSQVDPNYLNIYELQQKVEEMLSSSQNQDEKDQKITTKKLQRLSRYKTYKIVALLQEACLLRVRKIKIKWMLNDYDQLVLLDCLQYQIDHQHSLALINRGKRNSHAEHILKNGLDYLKQYYNIEDFASISKINDNVQQLIRIRRQSRQSIHVMDQNFSKDKKFISKSSKNQFAYSRTIETKKKKKLPPRYFQQKIQKLSRSTPLYQSIKNRKSTVNTLKNRISTINSRKRLSDSKNLQQHINQYNPLQIIRDCKQYLNQQKSTEHQIVQVLDKEKLTNIRNNEFDADGIQRAQEKLNLLKLIRDRYSYNKKSYKLRPFKTEQRR